MAARARRERRPWEECLHLDGLEAALDQARDHLQAAMGGHAHAVAARAAVAPPGTPPPAPGPQVEADVQLALLALERYGHQSVLAELDAQRPDHPRHQAAVALNWVSDQGGLPGGHGGKLHRLVDHLKASGHTESSAVAIAVSQSRKLCATGHQDWCRLAGEWEAMKARQHTLAGGETGTEQAFVLAQAGWAASAGRLIASAIVHQAWQAAQRLLLLNAPPDAAQAAGAAEGERAARRQAVLHASSALAAGRDQAAQEHAWEIRGARYTSILDNARCHECDQADDGVLRPLDDPWWRLHGPPNPLCYGGGACRCIRVYELNDEAPASLWDPEQPRSGPPVSIVIEKS